MLLKDKISIVTGAARGIGFGIADKFLKEGAKVIVFDIVPKPEYIKDMEYHIVDVSDFNSVTKSIEEIIKKYKRVDVLVNSAGVIKREPFLEISEKNWDDIFNVDCKGTFICTQKVIKHMIEEKSGSIINISSIAGHIVRTNQAHYCAAKAAVIHLTKCVAMEFAHFKVRVNCICPGMTYSEMLKEILERESLNKERFLKNIPMGKFASLSDHAEMAAYLASDKALHITGQIIDIDGGQSLNFVY